jgi:hypothetical protein
VAVFLWDLTLSSFALLSVSLSLSLSRACAVSAVVGECLLVSVFVCGFVRCSQQRKVERKSWVVW